MDIVTLSLCNQKINAVTSDLYEGDTGVIKSAHLPSYVDDIVEYANRSSFPNTGESGKIYLALDSGLSYRWSGSTYVLAGERYFALIAPEYSATTQYYTNDAVIYEGQLYRARKSAKGKLPTNTTYWTSISVTKWLKEKADTTTVNSSLNTLTNALNNKADKNTIFSDPFSSDQTIYIEGNTEYYFDELTSLTLTGVGHDENLGDLFYMGFKSGSTSTVLTLASAFTSKVLSDSLTNPEANKFVEICGKWNGSKWIVYMNQTSTSVSPGPTPGDLPDEYQAVYGIRSTGEGQYIDLGIHPYAESTLTMTGYMDNFGEYIPGQSAQAIFGSTGYGLQFNNYFIRLGEPNNGYPSIDMSIADNVMDPSASLTTSIPPYIPFDYEISLDNTYLTMDLSFTDGNTININYTARPFSYNTNDPTLTLFGINTPDWGVVDCASQHNSVIKSFIYDDNVNDIHLNLAPCYRKYDNEPGFYDLIGGQFYTNDGSGSLEVVYND